MTILVQYPMFNQTTRFVVILLALAGLSGAQAATIHKWVDDEGVTHYSDEPPEDTQKTVTRLPIEAGISSPTPAEGAASDHYYSIANQWRRMQLESLQRQQRELQRAELKREPEAAPPASEYQETRGTSYVTAYPYKKHRRHHRYRPGKRHAGYHQQPVRASSGGFPTTN